MKYRITLYILQSFGNFLKYVGRWILTHMKGRHYILVFSKSLPSVKLISGLILKQSTLLKTVKADLVVKAVCIDISSDH